MTSLEYQPDFHIDSSTNGARVPEGLQVWLERRKQAQSAKSEYEAIWRICQQFIANKQWVAWSRNKRQIIDMLKDDPREKNREHYTANRITNYLWTVVGKLYTDDFRPDVLFRREDIESESVAAQAQRALEYGWDCEFNAEEVLFEVILGMCGYGTEGLRVRFDPTLGAHKGQAPVGPDGQTILHVERAHAYMADAHSRGERPELRNVHEGKIVWEDLTPDNILPPPGVRREKDFPWLIIERPVAIKTLKGMYPDAKGIKESNLSSLDGSLDEKSSRLKGHANFSTGYERPCPEYPDGRTVYFAGDVLLEERPSLPIKVMGEPRMGVYFFHYHRRKDTFWSQGVVEPQIGPQRNLNRSRSQMIEMKDRMGLGRVYARKGTYTVKTAPQGRIGEIIEVQHGMDYPQEVQGVGPGPWIESEAQITQNDMEEIAGLSSPSLGQAPQGVAAYSAMALLKEEDDRRTGPILLQARGRVADAAEVTLEMMRLYWLPTKEIIIAGPTNVVDSFKFQDVELPATYFVRVGKGAPRPRSQAADIQMCFDIYDRSIQGGQPLPLPWLVDSLKAGKPLPLPKTELEVQRRLAEFENIMLSKGEMVQPHEGDNDQMHIQIHQAAAAAFQLVPGGEQIVAVLQAHIDAHKMAMQLKQGAAGAGIPLGGVPQLQGPQGQQSAAPPGPPQIGPPGASGPPV